MTVSTRVRRKQIDRTTETRDALIAAAIRVLHRVGYGGATTAVIAEEAGVTRGAILHHFGTRAGLMTEVIRVVYEQEIEDYRRLQDELKIGDRPGDWVQLSWKVLGKPSGQAVLEILQAARSDTELAAMVAPMQAFIEQRSLMGALDAFEGDERSTMTFLRLVVWGVRGLTMASVLAADPQEIERSVRMFQRLIEAASGQSLAGSDKKRRGTL